MELGIPPKPNVSEAPRPKIAMAPISYPYKLRTTSVVLFLILVVAMLVGGFYFYKNYFSGTSAPPPQACTQEAKQCPDGSYVGRTGPNCEFSRCPSLAATSTPVATSTTQ